MCARVRNRGLPAEPLHRHCTQASLIGAFEREDLLHETTGNRRNRVWRYTPFLSLFRDDVPLGGSDVALVADADAEPAQVTAIGHISQLNDG